MGLRQELLTADIDIADYICVFCGIRQWLVPALNYVLLLKMPSGSGQEGLLQRMFNRVGKNNIFILKSATYMSGSNYTSWTLWSWTKWCNASLISKGGAASKKKKSLDSPWNLSKLQIIISILVTDGYSKDHLRRGVCIQQFQLQYPSNYLELIDWG